MANTPDGLKYTKSHEWVMEEDGLIVVGLTDFAQEALGELVFVNLPEEGDEVVTGDSFADVESVKAVSDVYSPVTGVVVAVNEDLLDDPGLINREPYDAWLIKIDQVSEQEDLLTAEEYDKHCAEEE